MRNRLLNSVKVIATLLVFSSCYHNKKLVYFQGAQFKEDKPTLMANHRDVYVIRPNDVLSVKVKSSTDPQISDLFNITSTQQMSQFASPGNLYVEGYSVAEDGTLSLPMLGKIAVQDLTLEQATERIQKTANSYLKNATVIVKFISFKITVLGDVANPGYWYVYNNQATLLEGLGLAGDLTATANRHNVKLIRQVPNGSEVVLLDMTDPETLKSKYFYLMPNDVIYVEPLKARSKRLNLELLTLVFSGITTAVLILNYVDNQQN